MPARTRFACHEVDTVRAVETSAIAEQQHVACADILPERVHLDPKRSRAGRLRQVDPFLQRCLRIDCAEIDQPEVRADRFPAVAQRRFVRRTEELAGGGARITAILRGVEHHDAARQEVSQRTAVAQARIVQVLDIRGRCSATPTGVVTVIHLSVNAHLKLLIVDDDPHTRELLSEALEVRGADVLVRETAHDARSALATWHPDLVISDLAMPREDGYEFIRRVRHLPPEQGGRVPAIACTGNARAEDRTRAMRAGFDAVVAKPVDIDALVDTILHVAGVRGVGSAAVDCPLAAGGGAGPEGGLGARPRSPDS